MENLINQNYSINTVNPSVQKKDKKVDFIKIPVGVAAGTASAWGVRKAFNFIFKRYSKYVTDNLCNLSPQEKEIFINEADRMVEESKIASKGFKGINIIGKRVTKSACFAPKKTIEFGKILNAQTVVKKININTGESKVNFIDFLKANSPKISKQSLKDAIDKMPQKLIKLAVDDKTMLEEASLEMQKEISNSIIKGSLVVKLKGISSIASGLIKKFSNILTGKFAKEDMTSILKYGCFESLTNKIYTQSPSSLLHECGHAINKNKNFITRIPANLAFISGGFLIPAVIINAMFTKKSDETDKDKENSNVLQKIRNFTHNHIGLTVAALFTPTLLEEFLASFRAIKFVNASKEITEAMKKQHNRALKLAFGTYLLGGALLALASEAAVRVKDKIWSYQPKGKAQSK